MSSSTWETSWKKWYSSKELQICRSESDEDRMARACLGRGGSSSKSESLIDYVGNCLEFGVSRAEGARGKSGWVVGAKAREVSTGPAEPCRSC